MRKKSEEAMRELTLRLPERLRKIIDLAAKARFGGHGVSLNTEIIDRLERSFGRGLLEEILTHAYGPTTGAILTEAHRNGMRITEAQAKQILESVRVFLDHVQKGEAAI